ncbi:MAG: hypothetical protein QOF09_4182 [Alphaproteobacteria bacterium]|jgi:Ni/Co efflux regulator RcnB|nr:hypothetical protein [Alphaproteobacteria bacterium]
MLRSNRGLVLVALAVVLTAATAAAQQTPREPTTATPAKPNAKASGTDDKAQSTALNRTWDETKAMTRKQWNAAKKKWATEKVKWQDCNRQSAAEKLSAPKSWSFIASCMTKT